MHKIQTIISLFLFLVIVFSMDMIFGNSLMETFRGVRGVGVQNVRQNVLNNNNSNNSGFLAGDVPPSYFDQSDDEPLFFRSPFRFNQK
jgi:hypothetical protein